MALETPVAAALDEDEAVARELMDIGGSSGGGADD
eukprot:COSAG01_NODE_62500_length_284_cov_0.843243_1_plen_34_part_01